MPFGVKGGDTPESTKFMEDCVPKVMKEGKDKGNAVAICKFTYEKHNGDSKAAMNEVDKILELIK
jgi:hypothetical protein